MDGSPCLQGSTLLPCGKEIQTKQNEPLPNTSPTLSHQLSQLTGPAHTPTHHPRHTHRDGEVFPWYTVGAQIRPCTSAPFILIRKPYSGLEWGQNFKHWQFKIVTSRTEKGSFQYRQGKVEDHEKKITRFDYINIYTPIGPKTKLKDKPKRKLEGKKKIGQNMCNNDERRLIRVNKWNTSPMTNEGNTNCQ